MENELRTIISLSHMTIRTRICPCGHVYLYVGHTCVYLRQEEFLDLAQVIEATEQHMLAQEDPVTNERRH